MIPYGRQDITEEDIQAVVRVLKSDWLTQGPAIEGFEKAVAARVGAAHAVAVSNATAALHIACLAGGLGPGDRLWTSPNTFVASANCGLYCGARVDFVDIDPVTLNMDADALEAKLAAAAPHARPKVVVPVHFAGLPCDMERIGALAREYGFTVIEDASHAIGSRIGSYWTGSCRHSAMTVFSFHPVKIITTGEGGLITTNDPALQARLALLRTHGITREPALMESPSEGPWYYQQVDLGFNYRMTDLQAALGESQLKRLDAFVERRNRLAERYDRALSGMPVVLPGRAEGRLSSFHLYPIQVGEGSAPRKTVFERLRAAGIGVNLHYIPVHTQPYYRRLGFKPGDFPRAEAYYRGAISLPLYAGLSDADQDKVVEALKASIGA